MGLVDFIKGIGKKNTAPAEPQAAPATPQAAPVEPSAQEVANKLLGLIKSLGLGIDGLSVTYNGNTDTAIIKGQVKSQADKEKIVLIVGNIDHVAQVDDQMTVEVPAPESKFYAVKSGDNLSKIATQQNVSITDLKRWNNLSSNALKIGQNLTLAASSNGLQTTQSAAATFYKVRAGDSLYAIAKRHKVSLKQLQNWNPKIRTALKPGQTLALYL